MKILKGNRFDSRKGRHSYAMWTEGYDVCIEEDGRKYFYQLRNYDHDVVERIGEVEITEPVEIAWEELNESIKKAHFKVVHPDATESALNLFVYGEEKGKKINTENEWADAHMVFNREITLKIAEELGHFESVEFLHKISRRVGTGYIDYIYVVDGNWQVTVSENNYASGSFYASYSISDYKEVVEKQKAFGKRVAKLANLADVPWNIAVFVGHIESDEEAVQILKLVKEAKGTADEGMQWELSCGIGRRTSAISAMLGEVWEKLNCRGQKQTTTLAKYLLG